MLARALFMAMYVALVAVAPACAEDGTPPPAASGAVCSRDETILSGVQPKYPNDASASDKSRQHTVLVAINLGADGKLLRAAIYRGSGERSFDDAALQSVKASTFLPKVENCRTVASESVFRIDFPAIQVDCNRPANVVIPMSPDYPEGMQRVSVRAAEVLVLVHVGADGQVSRVEVQKSSGYPSFDRATLRAAALSTYEARFLDCKPVEGTYVFRAEFDQ